MTLPNSPPRRRSSANPRRDLKGAENLFFFPIDNSNKGHPLYLALRLRLRVRRLGMHFVYDAVLFPEMNREHSAMMTTPRSHTISSCDVAAMRPSFDGPPGDHGVGRRGRPGVDRGDSGDDARMQLRRLGSELRSLPNAPGQGRGAVREGDGEHISAATTLRPNASILRRRRCDASEPRWSST